MCDLESKACAKSCGTCGKYPGPIDTNFVAGEGCGTRFVEDDINSHSHSRIVGGNDAVRGSLPWIVSIKEITHLKRSHYWDHFCGGTIVGKRWILTAAHCFKGKNSGIKIVSGEYNLHHKEGSEQNIQVSQIYCHSGFNPRLKMRDPGYHDNDICLLKLSQDLKFDQFTQPACLPKIANKDRDYRTGDNVIVSGWGVLRFRGSYPSTLQMITVLLISTQTCNRTGVYSGKILSSMICAGRLSGGVDTCKGDSGGPLVKMVDGKWTVLGVVSWGIGCAGRNKPGVYASVVEFEKWIKDTMSKN